MVIVGGSVITTGLRPTNRTSTADGRTRRVQLPRDRTSTPHEYASSTCFSTRSQSPFPSCLVRGNPLITLSRRRTRPPDHPRTHREQNATPLSPCTGYNENRPRHTCYARARYVMLQNARTYIYMLHSWFADIGTSERLSGNGGGLLFGRQSANSGAGTRWRAINKHVQHNAIMGTTSR